MKDKWINTGHEGDDLKPHIEPVEDYSDPARIGECACRFASKGAPRGVHQDKPGPDVLLFSYL